MDKNINIPDWLYRILQGGYHNWLTYTLAIVFAVVVSAVVYIIKAKASKDLEDKVLHKLLLLVTLLFTGIQYLIPYLRDHLASLQTLPYVGEYVVGIYAAANFLYAVRLKSWFKVVFAWVSKQDATAPALPDPLPVQTVQPSPDANSDF